MQTKNNLKNVILSVGYLSEMVEEYVKKNIDFIKIIQLMIMTVFQKIQ